MPVQHAHFFSYARKQSKKYSSPSNGQLESLNTDGGVVIASIAFAVGLASQIKLNLMAIIMPYLVNRIQNLKPSMLYRKI